MTVRHRLSKIFQPIINVPKTASLSRQDVTSNSQRLMLELGLIQHANPGCFHFLPVGLKSLNKLIDIVDDEMEKIGGQKVLFPGLINSKLWEKSGRIKQAGDELFRLDDRHNQHYILSPTHEEAASDLLSSIPPISYKHFPLLLYQISSKYRDEIKPRFGLMRGREFLMKDMYSFDVDIDNAKKTYEAVCQSYDKIFQKIGLEYLKVVGTSGFMGGHLSHEYQFKALIGEDKVLTCSHCDYAANQQLYQKEKTSCPKCGDDAVLQTHNGIEVGHTFFLGDKYSKPLNANFLSKSAKPEVLQMGSYGLGLSRILAAVIEVLSSETEMRWPDVLAPYNVVVLPPKAGSKEESKVGILAETLYNELEREIPALKNNVLLDDRTSFTIGKRVLDARRVGYRYVIVINKRTTEDIPLFELNDIKTGTKLHLDKNELFQYVKKNKNF